MLIQQLRDACRHVFDGEGTQSGSALGPQLHAQCPHPCGCGTYLITSEVRFLNLVIVIGQRVAQVLEFLSLRVNFGLERVTLLK